MNDTNQYLTFTLEGEQYAISVLKVREVLEYTRITKIPKTAAYMKGVINLRGSGVPVIDLRAKFGMGEAPNSKDTSIIVMEVEGGNGGVVLGALADSVQEVIELEPSQIEPPPRFGTRLATEFILGMGKRDDKFIILLDIDKIFSSDEVVFLKEIETEKETVQA
ncbi:MAG TPA: chemotaxis protein CheW [Treponema sp.]|nr:MAG: chemotaxis protein CheW [Treponema sp. RIFOXYC1_FULL_61_9]HCM27971.1 chemotaxis protein CheW [Treponema sp.]